MKSISTEPGVRHVNLGKGTVWVYSCPFCEFWTQHEKLAPVRERRKEHQCPMK